MISWTWLPWALLSATFAALTAIFGRLGVQAVNADLATLIRAVVIVICLAAFVRASGQWISPLTLSARTWTFLVLSGLAAGASWVCYFRALRLGTVSQVAPVDKLSVVIATIFAVAFLSERPSVRDWIGIALIGGGVVLIALRR